MSQANLMNEESKIKSPTICRNIYITPLNEISAAYLNREELSNENINNNNKTSNTTNSSYNTAIQNNSNTRLDDQDDDPDNIEANNIKLNFSKQNQEETTKNEEEEKGSCQRPSTSRTVAEIDEDSLLEQMPITNYDQNQNSEEYKRIIEIEVQQKIMTDLYNSADDDYNHDDQDIKVRQEQNVFKAFMIENLETLDCEEQ